MQKIQTLIITIIIGSILSFIAFDIENSNKFFSSIFVPSPTITLIPVPTTRPTKIPLPTIIPTVGQVKAAYIEPTVDPDPIITCMFDHVPSQKMRKSECNKSFECEIDKWYIYYDVEKCKKDQDNYFSRGTTTYDNSFSTYAPLPTYEPLPTYPPFESFNEWKQNNPEPQEVDNGAYEDCMNKAVEDFNAAKQRANSGYGGGSSVGQAMIDIAQQDYDRAVDNCN